MAAHDLAGFEAGDDTVIWRYMPLARFHALLSGNLYFAAARQFGDQFEGAITDAERAWRKEQAARVFEDEPSRQRDLAQLSSAFEDLRRMTKVNCWHAATDENVAMWERYLGQADAGVAVRSTVGALKRSLHEFRLQPSNGEEPTIVGRVRYIDFATQELIHRSMLELFLYKRIEFRDEREVRAILSLRMAVEFGVPIPDDGVNVAVDLDELIDEVRVWSQAGQISVRDVSTAVADIGLRCPVTHSTLARAPTY